MADETKVPNVAGEGQAPVGPGAPVQPASQAAFQQAPAPASAPQPTQAPVGAPQSAPAAAAQQPPQYTQPSYQASAPVAPAAPQPVYPPAPLMQLTTGMKFAWLVVGALLGIPGILVAWLANVDKVPQVKNDAVKFSAIGLIVWVVLGIIATMAIFGMITAGAAAVTGVSYGSHSGYQYF